MTQTYISIELPADGDELKVRTSVYRQTKTDDANGERPYTLTIALEKTAYNSESRICVQGSYQQMARMASAITEYLDRSIDEDDSDVNDEASMVAAIDRASDRVRAASHAFALVTEKWTEYQAKKREVASSEDDNDAEDGTTAGDLAFDAARERGKV